MDVKKAIFPVAGLGSRFLPATKANPKEMLPIVDKPLIQYAVEEAVKAGITHMIFITSSTKRAIEDHFDNHFELEKRLEEQGKNDLLNVVRNIAPPGICFSYVRQNQPLGLGHAILCAEEVVGNEPFAVLLADDLIDDSRIPCLTTMVNFYNAHKSSILAIQEVPLKDVHHYGVVEINDIKAPYPEILNMIEKPSVDAAPTNLACVGRYVFTSTIFNCLKSVHKDYRGEIQLTGGIEKLLQLESVHAYVFNGRRYDCGSKLGYLQATVAFGIKHVEIGESFKKFLLGDVDLRNKYEMYGSSKASS